MLLETELRLPPHSHFYQNQTTIKQGNLYFEPFFLEVIEQSLVKCNKMLCFDALFKILESEKVNFINNCNIIVILQCWFRVDCLNF